MRHAKIGKFLKIVIKNTTPELRKKRKKKTRAIVIRTNHWNGTSKGFYYKFSDNALVLLKKRMNTVGKEMYGSTSKILKIKKFKIAFHNIF
jgi:large subunit ribosomal protein L14